MSKTINLDIPSTAEERIAKEADSIYGLIKRIEARASDGRYYAMEDTDRAIIISFLKKFASGYAEISDLKTENDANDFYARGEHAEGVTR